MCQSNVGHYVNITLRNEINETRTIIVGVLAQANVDEKQLEAEIKVI